MTIWILLLIFFATLFWLNSISTKRDTKKYTNILNYINSIKTIKNTKVELSQKEEWYKDAKFFKMHNCGNNTENNSNEELEKMKFIPIANITDYYL